ncbi:hypothetical protein ACH4NF_09495 [Streptomyces sp. NPDC017248]|uniref:hypothetical protein n=1 Tax=unclassified Streptomyces TaxID=2593676 RepID=UPI0037B2E3AC
MLDRPLSCCEVAVSGRTSAPYARPTARRAVTAAVIATTTLLLAANAGPARAASSAPAVHRAHAADAPGEGARAPFLPDQPPR